VKKGIFGRIFLLYAVALIAAVLFVEFYITGVVRGNYISNLRDNLAVQAELVAENISFDPAHKLDSVAARFKDITDARVTVVAPGGQVLGDSDSDSSLMENHADRPEIVQAGFSGTGWAIRHSDTLDTDFLYTVVRAIRGGLTVAFVRLAVPLEEVNRAVNLLRLKLDAAVILALLLTAALHTWQTGRIRRLTRQVTDFSGAIVGGDFGKRLLLGGMGEYGEIAENLNTMSEEMRKRIEESEQEKDRLNVILRSIPDALLIIDGGGSIVLSSQASREFFGDVPVSGRHHAEVVRSHEFTSMLGGVGEGRVGDEREITLDHPEERHCIVRVSPLFFKEGEPSGFLAIFHDITRLKKLEDVRKDFVANVSHEIRTPIAAIKGFAETLLEGALEDGENARKFLGTIKSNSERLNSLVEDLLTISRVELGDVKVEKAPVNIADVIAHVVATLNDRAASKKLYLKTEVTPGTGEISADRNRLTQILTNLVDNAIKFTEEGGVTVGAAAEDGRTVLLVRDTGIGVPRRYVQRLGERFFRVDPSRSRAMGGTGLGLAIVKHLVRAHGWEMQIESTEGQGTTVKVIIS
jgi:two-component system phosphate regulon sensor histidine kinase PhoR